MKKTRLNKLKAAQAKLDAVKHVERTGKMPRSPGTFSDSELGEWQPAPGDVVQVSRKTYGPAKMAIVDIQRGKDDLGGVVVSKQLEAPYSYDVSSSYTRAPYPTGLITKRDVEALLHDAQLAMVRGDKDTRLSPETVYRVCELLLGKM